MSQMLGEPQAPSPGEQSLVTASMAFEIFATYKHPSPGPISFQTQLTLFSKLTWPQATLDSLNRTAPSPPSLSTGNSQASNPLPPPTLIHPANSSMTFNVHFLGHLLQEIFLDLPFLYSSG